MFYPTKQGSYRLYEREQVLDFLVQKVKMQADHCVSDEQRVNAYPVIIQTRALNQERSDSFEEIKGAEQKEDESKVLSPRRAAADDVTKLVANNIVA